MELLGVAVAPGIFWLWYFRTRDRLRPEPRHLVGWTFAAGMLAALVAGVIEEAVKFLAVLIAVYRRAQFDEVMDGIVYAVAASLGLATLENVGFVLQGGYGVALLRAILSVPGHAFFGVVLGFYMGVAKFAGRAEARWLSLGLVLAAAVHAAYDAALFTGTLVALLVIPFVFLLWRASLAYVRRALALDEERLGRKLV